MPIISFLAILLLLFLLALAGLRIANYERAVIFRLGKYAPPRDLWSIA